MFGLIDRYYAFRKCREDYVEPQIDWKPEDLLFGPKKTTWICFVPSIVSKVQLIRRGIIPREGHVYVYTISSFNIMMPDPRETVAKLENIYADAFKKAKKAIEEGHSVCLLGVSLGNVLTTRLAAEIRMRIKTIISIVGGGHLGLSGWDSILTGHLARQSQCASTQEYEDALSVFSPVNYCGSILADRVVIRLATHDLLIPFGHGKVLARAFMNRSKETHMKVDYGTYRGADHASALFFASIEKLWKQKV